MRTDFEYLKSALVEVNNEANGNTPLTPALLVAIIQMAEQKKESDAAFERDYLTDYGDFDPTGQG